jgi:hypothetical protein
VNGLPLGLSWFVEYRDMPEVAGLARVSRRAWTRRRAQLLCLSVETIIFLRDGLEDLVEEFI